MKEAIAYYRVSTERQGKSGLGLDAQKQAVHGFTGVNDYKLVAEFIEIESGKNSKRPVLHDTLAACKERNATLLIAKLDRLGRSVAFISRQMEAGLDFIAVDNPEAGKFLVHIIAAFAEYERDLISERTTAALKAAKAKGVELGKHGRYVLSAANKRQADLFAATMQPIIQRLRQRGITTVRAIAQELNRRAVPTSTSGGRWHPTTVQNIIRRMKLIHLP